MTFDIVAVLFITPPDKQRLRRRGDGFRPSVMASPSGARALPRQILDFRIAGYRATTGPFLDPYRVVLCFAWYRIRHMFGGVVTPPDKGNTIITTIFMVHSADNSSQPSVDAWRGS